MKKIRDLYPFEKVLEIGCASGPNVYRIAMEFPYVSVAGIDVSSKAVEEGNRFLAKNKVWNAALQEGCTFNLSSIPDRSFDIVFSDAVMIYVKPDKIARVLENIKRIAKKSVVLVEWHWDALDRSCMDSGYWVHNYRIYYPHSEIERIPYSVWTNIGWLKYGSIISERI